MVQETPNGFAQVSWLDGSGQGGGVCVCVCACWGLDELAGMNGGLDEWGWDLRWCQQRDALIKLRNDNPGMRIRTPDQLGVRSKLVRTRSWLVWLTRNIK